MAGYGKSKSGKDKIRRPAKKLEKKFGGMMGDTLKKIRERNKRLKNI